MNKRAVCFEGAGSLPLSSLKSVLPGMRAFYASVAQHLGPRLRGRAVAVAGDPERRADIILAKSREAKAAGVKTATSI